MAFLVKYLQDIPKDCGECPCSIHITPKEVYCNARQKHFVVSDNRPEECEMTDANEISKEMICKKCGYHVDAESDKVVYCNRFHIAYMVHMNNYHCEHWIPMEKEE